MNSVNLNVLIKQTALLLLCGLLPCMCFAQQRNIKDAENVANSFITRHFSSLRGMTLKLKQASSFISQNGNLNKDKEAYYIFTNTSNGKGFVIVSGDERMPSVLAYSEDNNFDIDSLPPNVRYWLDCYAEAFLMLNNETLNSSYKTISVQPGGVAPMLDKNVWGQDDPFNRLCPSIRGEKCVTGCVATAMAQVMNYHKYPNKGKGIVNYRTQTNNIFIRNDLDASSFKWNDILDDYNKKYTSEQAEAVAVLMYACGSSVKMDYCTNEQGGSGAYQTELITAFVDNFYYDNDASFMARSYCSIEDWHQLIVNELNEGRPVNYSGQSTRDGGHSFVFDGYRISKDNKYPDYHVNWGWNGRCDGYYQIVDLHPSEDGQHATYGGFNDSQQMTIGIKPNDGLDSDKRFLCTPNLYVSSSTTKAGNTIQVYTASCINLSYKQFNGNVYVSLISLEDSSEIILGEHKMKSLSYLQEQKNLSIDIAVPSDIAEGQYKIQLRSKLAGNGEYHQVISKQYPILNISPIGGDSPIVEEKKAMLGSSEIEVVSVSDSSLISLNIYELQNIQDSPFIGDLKMILADKSGKQLFSFGDSIQPGELSTFEIQENPINIQGQFEGDWPDGDYKLYVGARQINTSKFEYVSFYDVTQPDMTYHDLCLSTKIKDGKIIVNGVAFIIPTPTLIDNIRLNENNNDGLDIYRLDGSHLSDKDTATLPAGIYIIRQGKETRKIIVK